MITTADTVFIASIYKSSPETASQFPSHAGMNARGGLPGFIRVLPSDGRSVVLPDYSGNRFMSSLGNIESSRLAGFTIVSFETGDILYLTGKARVLIGAPALEIMRRHASITVLETTGYTLVRDALPVRQVGGSKVGRSPYSPKVKYLVEEDQGLSGVLSDNHKAQLEIAVQLSKDLAVLRFKVVSKDKESPLKIRPGQAIVLDFMDWIGPPEYHHMADAAPGSINDDRVRTWTVSSAHENEDATWFELTMREMKGGVVTGALFDVLRKNIPPTKWGRTLPVTDTVVTDVVGVTGDFCLKDGDINVLWVAGGIGITPFLSMLEALARGQDRSGDIQFALSTREPTIMLDVMRTSLRSIPATIKIKIDMFTRYPPLDTEDFNNGNTHISIHQGRIGPEYWKAVATDKDVFICGPNEFGNVVTESLRDIGIPDEQIHREGFY